MSFSSIMTASTTTLEEWTDKQKAAEERRKKMEQEKMDRLAEAEKHAQEVRAAKEKNQSATGDAA